MRRRRLGHGSIDVGTLGLGTGPRTPAQLGQLLDAGHVDLPADVAAAIDMLLPPGTSVNPAPLR